MKEIIRLEHISCEPLLSDYCLSVCENRTVYVQSLSYRSLHLIAQLLSGEKTCESGVFVIGKTKYRAMTPELMRREGIYRAAMGEEFIPGCTVAENMMIASGRSSWHSPLREEENVKACDALLRKYDIAVGSRAKTDSLGVHEKQLLSILQAQFAGARLIILEMSGKTETGTSRAEIIQLIQRLNKEGMAFLILASRYSEAAESASEIQFVQYGMALRQWRMPDETALAFLRAPSLENRHTAAHGAKPFTGLYDSEWSDEGTFFEYLDQVKKYNSSSLEQYFSSALSADETHTVIVPMDSYDQLIRTLSVKENLSIALKEKITRAHMIQPRLEERVFRDFCETYGIDYAAGEVSGLSRLERKILSIERFALLKPSYILLEDPYRAVHVRDIPAMRAYMESLVKREIKVFYFSRSDYYMKEDCAHIICTRNCKNLHLL